MHVRLKKFAQLYEKDPDYDDGVSALAIGLIMEGVEQTEVDLVKMGKVLHSIYVAPEEGGSFLVRVNTSEDEDEDEEGGG